MKKVDSTGDLWVPFPGACRLHAWKPRRACPWATGAARTKPLSADNGRPLAQVVISSGMLRTLQSEGKKAHVSHGKVLLNRFTKKELSAPALLFCVVEFLTGHAHVQKYRARTRTADVPPRPVPPTSLSPCFCSPFRIRGGICISRPRK